MENYFVLIFISILFTFTSGGKLPSDFKICKRHDPNINDCLKIAIHESFAKLRNGITDLSVPAIEPLNVPSVTIGEGKGPVNVLQKYKNIDIHNVTSSYIDSIDANVGDPLKMVMHISASEYRLLADYDFNGRILLLPIVGTGKCTIILDNPKSTLTLIGEKIVKKGIAYMKIKDFKIDINPEKVHFNFENLFNGDAKLGTEMNKLLNDNWKDVYEDVKVGYEEFIGSIGKHVTNSIFLKVPYDDLFPPK